MSGEQPTGQDTPAVAGEVTNPEAAPANAAQAQAQTDGAQVDNPSPAQEKTFSQKELDEILQKRLAKERRQSQQQLRQAIQLAREMHQPTQQREQQPSDDGKPRREQFASEDAWLDARDAWRDQQREQKAQAERTQAQQKTLAERTEKLYADAAKLPGFDADAFDDVLDTPGLTREAVLALIDSDVGPQLMAHLAGHPDEAARIAKLPAVRQAAEIGKLEDRITAAPKPPAVKKPGAPAPIEPIGGGASPIKTLASAQNMDDFKAAMRKAGSRWVR
jgi:hypothetical protein